MEAFKKILITGTNSYIGTGLEGWLKQWPEEYIVESVDMVDDLWRQKDFSGFDTVFHVAAIVHASIDRKDQCKAEALYQRINCDLAVEVAEKAKSQGVKQFIFMSTMAVYGNEGKLGENVVINEKTEPSPKTFYAKSKLLAEYGLNGMAGDDFKIAIIRSPMVYGENCPGNYRILERFALKTPAFPMIENKRSMVHIHKLNECIKEYIDFQVGGLFFPQDSDYVNTSLLVQRIAMEHGRKIHLSKTLGMLIRLFGRRSKLVNKVFGDLVYEK